MGTICFPLIVMPSAYSLSSSFMPIIFCPRTHLTFASLTGHPALIHTISQTQHALGYIVLQPECSCLSQEFREMQHGLKCSEMNLGQCNVLSLLSYLTSARRKAFLGSLRPPEFQVQC